MPGDVLRAPAPTECPECHIDRLVFAVREGWPPRCLICEAYPMRRYRKHRQRGFSTPTQTFALLSIVVLAVIAATRAGMIGSLLVLLLAAMSASTAYSLAKLIMWLVPASRTHFLALLHWGESNKPASFTRTTTKSVKRKDDEHGPLSRAIRRGGPRPIPGTTATALHTYATCSGCGQERKIFTEFGVCLKCSPPMKQQPKEVGV